MRLKKYYSQTAPDQLSAKLKSYSLLASGILSGILYSDGAVQYTDIDPDNYLPITHNSIGNLAILDIDNDSNPDFLMSVSQTFDPFFDYTTYELNVRGLNTGNAIAGINYFDRASAIGSSETIDGSLSFMQNRNMAGSAIGPAQRFYFGEWLGARFKNLGLKFEIAGQTHYGWVRLSVLPPNPSIGGKATIAFHDFGWETAPNTPIVTLPSPQCDTISNTNVSSNIRYTSVNFNWSQTETASRYQIRARETAGPGSYTILGIKNPLKTNTIIRNLTPGTSYEISMRSICFGNLDTSQWSIPMAFTTFDCIAPDTNYVTGVTSTSATLNWIAPTIAVEPKWYFIVGRPVGNLSFATFAVSPAGFTTLNTYQVTGLHPGVSYEWGVYSECEDDLFSPLSAVDTFTTLSSSSKNAMDESILPNPVSIIPNPISGTSVIRFNNDDGSNYQLTLTDMNGKVVRLLNNITGGEVMLEKSDVTPGMYLLELKGKKYFAAKVLVN